MQSLEIDIPCDCHILYSVLGFSSFFFFLTSVLRLLESKRKTIKSMGYNLTGLSKCMHCLTDSDILPSRAESARK